MARGTFATLVRAVAVLCAIARTAHADAAADVADLRAGMLPARHEALGWSAPDSLVVRRLVCVEGGTTACTAELGTFSPKGVRDVQTLLQVEELYCTKGKPCEPLSRPVVDHFVDAEKRALAKLPATWPAVASADPLSSVGIVAGAPTTVGFRTLAVADKERGDGVRLELVLKGGRGAVEPLAVLEPFAQRLEAAPRVIATYPSPDGASLAIVVGYATGAMCWGPFQAIQVRVVELAPRRASLANSVGFRAYKDGALSEALAAFTAATREDPRFGLGWFNRAAVEARLGRDDDAKASLAHATALDTKFGARACADKDFATIAVAIGCHRP